MRAVYEQNGIQAVVNGLAHEAIAYLVIRRDVLSQEGLETLAAQFGEALTYNDKTGDIAYAQVLASEENGSLKSPYAALQAFMQASEQVGVTIPRLVKNFLQHPDKFQGRVTEEDIFDSLHGRPVRASATR